MSSEKSCGGCGAKLLASDTFCPECGAAVGTQHNGVDQTAICRACGERIEASDEFCPSCGASLAPSFAPVAPASAQAPTMPLLPLGGSAREPAPPPITLQPLGGAAAVNVGAADVSSLTPGTPVGVYTGPSQPAPDSTMQHPVASEGQIPTPTPGEVSAQKSTSSNSLGWAIVAVVIFLGFGAVKVAINTGQRKTEELRAAAAAPSTPRPLTQEEIDAANNAQAWRVATQRANQIEARQRAEEAAKQRAAQQDWEETQRFAQQSNNDDNRLRTYRCSNCGQVIMKSRFDIEFGTGHPAGGICPQAPNPGYPYHKWEEVTSSTQ